MVLHQLSLPLSHVEPRERSGPYRDRLVALLSGDLDFHDADSGYASHNFHSFPAKFPPQLPRKFIQELTDEGQVVLDPMMGSGTTVLEALLAGRAGIGFDIDPLALLVSRVKVASMDRQVVAQVGKGIQARAAHAVMDEREALQAIRDRRWDAETRRFVDQWFAPEMQLELLALIREIERIDDPALADFFRLAFSATIITKNGGVSLSLDLAHTRPHRVKVVVDGTGRVLIGQDLIGDSDRRARFLTKALRSPLEEFDKRFHQNLKGLLEPWPGRVEPRIEFGDAQSLPLGDRCVELIVTSPPYASNAIDYMRAHKFSLVWLGFGIEELSEKRSEYIGGESMAGEKLEELPDKAARVVADIAELDRKKGRVLHRYYSEMTRVLREMLRVLRPGKAAILVVGSSTMRGRDTETHICLAEIGRALGFEVPGIGVRRLDRDRRMMPAGSQLDLQSQIQQRMHKEYVVGLLKPETEGAGERDDNHRTAPGVPSARLS